MLRFFVKLSFSLYIECLVLNKFFIALSISIRAVQGGSNNMMEDTKCLVYNNGSVVCIYSIHIDSLCVPDLSNYPYDSQSCDLRIGAWVHKGHEVDFKLTKDIVMLSSMEPNGEWEIVNYIPKKYGGTYPSMEIVFKLKRLHAAHTATVIIPSIVIVILTFTSLCVSPDNPERLILVYVNLVIQFMHVQYLSWQIPLKGDRVPLLLVFGRDSLLLAAFILIFTHILKNIMKRQTMPPALISCIVSFAIGSVPGRFLFLDDNSTKGTASAKGEEDGTTIIESNKKNPPDWEIFAKILDFALLLSYIIVYFIMAIKYIP